MTEIEVPDPDQNVEAESQENQSPYRNLLVPLVVVPAVIVMALVLVFVMFGAIAGEESSPKENLEKVMTGGHNESQQAAFNLMRQVIEDIEVETKNAELVRQGRASEVEESPWEIGADLVPGLSDALADRWPPDEKADVPVPLALAATLANLGDVGGVETLCSLLELTDEVDPGGEFRFQATMLLAALGRELEEQDAAVMASTARALIARLDDDDPGLRNAAVVALQAYATPESVGALEGMLTDSSLETRGCAALSLAKQGVETGSEVLRSMLLLSTYEEERAQEPTKWTKGEQISDSRQRALLALEQIDQIPSKEELQALVDDDPDSLVRELAMKFLEGS